MFGLRPDLVSGGHNGFLNDTARLHAIEFVRGGHGAALVPENMPNLARFALGDKGTLARVPNKAGATERPGRVDHGYTLCPRVWVAWGGGVLGQWREKPGTVPAYSSGTTFNRPVPSCPSTTGSKT